MVSPKKVTIVGSGNWGSAIARIVGNTVKQHREYFQSVPMWVFEEMAEDISQELGIVSADDELFRKVARWTRMLEKEDTIEPALRRLESLEINIQLLSETGVGKVVNSLRQHPKWGDRVTELVSRWKDAALAESKRQQSTSKKADFSFEVNTSMDTTVSEKEEEQNEEEIAVSYVIFDQNRMVLGANGIPDLWSGLLYIGQTRDPARRQINHKAAGRLDGTAQMYFVNKYEGKTAVLRSLIDEAAAFREARDHPKLFRNIKDTAQADDWHEPQKSALAWTMSDSEEIKDRMREDMKKAIREKRVWTGEKIFKCEICGRKFEKRRLLNDHVEEIHKMRALPCDQCDAVFYQEKNLDAHIKTHEENRVSHPCRFAECNRQYTSKGNLDRHIANDHEWDGTMHKCEAPNCHGGDNCGPKEYKYPWHLKDHYKDAHGWEDDKINEVMTSRQQRKNIEQRRPKRRISNVDPNDLEVIEKRRNSD